MLCSQLGVSYAHSFKSSFISVAEIFPLFMILDRRESNCQKLVAAWGSTKLILDIIKPNLIDALQHDILTTTKIGSAHCIASSKIYDDSNKNSATVSNTRDDFLSMVVFYLDGKKGRPSIPRVLENESPSRSPEFVTFC